MNNTITRDFGIKTRRALAARGIEIVGVTSCKVELANGSWDYERLYQVNDNGCGRIWSRRQVEQAAA